MRIMSLKTQSLILLILTLVSTLLLEHSQFDLAISQLFYNHVANFASDANSMAGIDGGQSGHWLVQKGAQPLAFLFYKGPKALLMVLGLILITRLIYLHSIGYGNKEGYKDTQNTPQNFLQPKALTPSTRLKNSKPFSGLMQLSKRDLTYLLLTLILVPTVTATFKSLTHVSCPSHLTLFNGDLPYLTIWQSIAAQTPVKCFPAAHASSGFALYGFVYVPSLRRHRYKIVIAVSLIGWTMGLYKMMIGDHFFSHTLVAMLLAATLASGLAAIIFQKDEPSR